MPHATCGPQLPHRLRCVHCTLNIALFHQRIKWLVMIDRIHCLKWYSSCTFGSSYCTKCEKCECVCVISDFICIQNTNCPSSLMVLIEFYMPKKAWNILFNSIVLRVDVAVYFFEWIYCIVARTIPVRLMHSIFWILNVACCRNVVDNSIEKLYYECTLSFVFLSLWPKANYNFCCSPFRHIPHSALLMIINAVIYSFRSLCFTPLKPQCDRFTWMNLSFAILNDYSILLYIFGFVVWWDELNRVEFIC